MSGHIIDMEEWCLHCREHVTIKADFLVQVCPSCEQKITPCNICENQECTNQKPCPLGIQI